MGVSPDLSARGGNKKNMGAGASPAVNQEVRRSTMGSKRSRKRNLAEGFGRTDVTERRDWPNLMPELVEDIAGRLLSLDVAEYLRFRAACKRWRQGTVGAGDGLDRRFRPRDWIVLSHCAAGTTRRRLLNLATAARADVDLPALSTHHHLGSADGLLVLCDRATEAVRLLNPLTGALTDFPAITAWVSLAPRPTSTFPLPSWCSDIVDPSAIDGASIDDSTSPPTLFLCLRGRVRWIVFARPGDQHWLSVGPYDFNGQVMYKSLLSLRGSTYIASKEGYIWEVDLHQPVPWLDYVVDKTMVGYSTLVASYLVPSEDARDGMLVVRYICNVNAHPDLLLGRPGPGPEVFTAQGVPRCVEVLEVDLAAGRLVPVKSLGRRAVFVGQTQCLSVSTETFPSLASNAVYLSCHLQEASGFSIYYLDPGSSGRRTEPVQEFVFSHHLEVSPLHRPCRLEDYLVCYVDRIRMLYD
ncbi:uncharacterized protein LOC133905725 [Phragmites australis]|uniref:uncharacterized protein LOC133905725 n=1 Tax=Phragmites australis TaxID=29695 RepID=UPI002D76BCEB|nr:uncharacterized protein LOC133905725 [Phragmites australis]